MTDSTPTAYYYVGIGGSRHISYVGSSGSPKLKGGRGRGKGVHGGENRRVSRKIKLGGTERDSLKKLFFSSCETVEDGRFLRRRLEDPPGDPRHRGLHCVHR